MGKPVEKVIEFDKANRRRRVSGFFVMFLAVLFATVAIFVTAGISVSVLVQTASSDKEKTGGSSDGFQDVLYTMVDGKIVKQYLSEEDLVAEQQHVEELEKELEEERKAAEEAKNTGSVQGYVPPAGPKIVYLTFDDGPSEHTGRLLDVLKKYDVKATFFVTCAGSQYRDMIKRASNEGHSIGLHTCSHNYANVYANEDAFFAEINQVSNVVKEQTGKESKLIRFPGGSSNTISAKYNKGIMSRLAEQVQAKGYAYFDWNVSSGDAGGATNADMVYNNIVYKLKGDYSIVLQHDIKGFSVDAVERVIQFGKANGFTFKALNISSPTAHHGINN